MAEIKWIKLSTDIFDNRKIKQIETMPDGDALVVIWLKLLILAGEVNDGGAVYFTHDIPYTDQLLATQFNRPLSTVQLALKTFKSFGMIDIVDDLILVSNWERYQNIEGMEKIREQTRKRVQKYRENKQIDSCNVTVTLRNATDKNRIEEEQNRIDNSIKPQKRFIPPTLDEVKEYCTHRNNGINAEQFIDHYSANGWKVGKNSMKDWKAAVRTWERNGYANSKAAAEPETSPSYDINRAAEKMNQMPKLRKKTNMHE